MINDNLLDARERLLPGKRHILAPSSTNFNTILTHKGNQSDMNGISGRRSSNQPHVPVSTKIVHQIASACEQLQKDEEQAVLFYSRPMVSSQAVTSITSSNFSLRERKDLHRSAHQIYRVPHPNKNPSINKSSRV